MAFHEVRFPTSISYGSSGGPEFSTDIVITHGGHEQRGSNWSAARARYNVAHGVKSQTQLDALIAFFRARRGRMHGFRLKDWGDFGGVNQTIGTGTGALTSFQLCKTYSSGAGSEVREIKKPVSGSVNIYVDSVLQTSGVSVDAATGIVTFGVAPAASAAVTADFEFDVPVRFDTDRLSATLDNYGSYRWADVPLVEVRV